MTVCCGAGVTVAVACVAALLTCGSTTLVDFSVVVVTGWSSSDTLETYRIHKSVVASGLRCSGYFQDIFKQDPKSSSVIIELNRQAAKAFPTMLDYLYDFKDGSLSINRSMAVPLRYLADYFEIRPMFDEANAFIEKDMKHTIEVPDPQSVRAAVVLEEPLPFLPAVVRVRISPRVQDEEEGSRLETFLDSIVELRVPSQLP